jgi:hypothetical protein
MCEELYEETEDELEEFGYEFGYFEEPPPKPKYYPASPPVALADRLRYFKYDRKFQKFVRELTGLFPQFEIGAKSQPKKKLLCVRLGTETFVLEPMHAQQDLAYTDVVWFGVTQRYPTAPPHITLRAKVIHKDEKVLMAKFQYMRDNFQQVNELSALICGQHWYATDIDCKFLPELSFEITFTLPSDTKQGMHRRMREAESLHKKRFVKFAAFK